MKATTAPSALSKLIAAGVVLVPAALIISAVNSSKLPQYTGDTPAAVQAPAQPAVDPQIEAMKQCAHDLKVERQRWFHDETGMTTTIDSGVAQAYADQMAAAGMETKTPLPFRLCG